MAKTVLIVDDSATMRHIVDLMLRQMPGVEVEQACDGVEALARIKASPPNLILADINMPNMGGFELLEKIRGGSVAPEATVIMAVKKGDTAMEEKCLALGANGCIHKPLDGAELVRIVRSYLG